jgi:FixJ family two-component response regulator
LQPEYCVKLARDPAAHAAITKPFDRNQLVAAVQQALAICQWPPTRE